MRLKVIVGQIIKDGVTIFCDLTEYISQGLWACEYDNSQSPALAEIEFQPNMQRHNEDLFASTVEHFLRVFDQKNAIILQDEHRRRKLEVQEYLSDWNLARQKRDEMLGFSDWVTLPDVALDETKKAEWLSWRNELRNITSSFATPADIVWPEPPAGASWKITERYESAVGNYSRRKEFLANWAELPSVSSLSQYEESGGWY
jgi:hypothetical protein